MVIRFLIWYWPTPRRISLTGSKNIHTRWISKSVLSSQWDVSLPTPSCCCRYCGRHIVKVYDCLLDHVLGSHQFIWQHRRYTQLLGWLAGKQNHIPNESAFLWFESEAWSSNISAWWARVAVRVVGVIVIRTDHSDSKTSPATIPVPGDCFEFVGPWLLAVLLKFLSAK